MKIAVMKILSVVVVILLNTVYGLPVRTENSAEESKDVNTAAEDPCAGLPCDQWAEVQKKLAFLTALEAKDTDSLLDSYNQEEQSGDTDGENEGPDILFTPEQIDEMLQTAVAEHQENHRQKRKVINHHSYRWDMPVHYIINNTFKDYQKDIIRSAVKQWEDNTCVTFVELESDAKPDSKHIVFQTKLSGCASYVGRVNLANTLGQPIYLATSCFGKFGTPVHEIGHALGLWHEHQRPSREGHITIMEENIVSYWLSNFRQKPKDRVESFGVPFDYNSVMHYGGKIGSKNGKHSILTEDPLFQGNIGQRVGLSFLDAKAVNHAYCEDQCESSELREPCEHGGYQDPKNCDSCRCPPGVTGQYCQTTAPSVGAECAATIEMTPGDEMNVKSPGYDTGKHYNNFLECNWLFKVPTGSHVEIDFQDEFAIYSSGTGICSHWLEIKYGADFGKPGPRFCGQDLPSAVLKSDGEEVLMTFRSNFGVDAEEKTRGFSVRVRAVRDTDTDSDEAATDDTTTTTTTTTPATTTTTPTTTTTTPTTTTKKASTPVRVTWGEWSECQGTGLQCACGGCSVKVKERFCDGEKCGQRTQTCNRVCVKDADTYSFLLAKTNLYTRSCPECCTGFHKVGGVCQKDES